MFKKIFEFIGSLKSRAFGNLNTTMGGGVVGVGLAALIGQLEAATGCHFQTAFANIDWLQIAGFVFSQSFGAMMTDANKTIAPKS
jgi:hypothetical protein